MKSWDHDLSTNNGNLKKAASISKENYDKIITHILDFIKSDKEHSSSHLAEYLSNKIGIGNEEFNRFVAMMAVDKVMKIVAQADSPILKVLREVGAPIIRDVLDNPDKHPPEIVEMARSAKDRGLI